MTRNTQKAGFEEFATLPGLPTDVGETKEVERFRFAFSPRFSICSCKTTELDQSCLVRVQLQSEPTQAFLRNVQ